MNYYVHRHFSNYLNYGLKLSRKENKNDDAASAYQRYNAKKEELRNNIINNGRNKSLHLEELENIYREIIFGNSAEMASIRQQLASVLQEKLGQNIVVNVDHLLRGEVNASSGELDDFQKALSATREAMDNSISRFAGMQYVKRNTLERIQKEVDTLWKELGDMQAFPDYIKAQLRVNHLNIRINTIKQKIQTIIDELNEQADSTGRINITKENSKSIQLLNSYIDVLFSTAYFTPGHSANIQGVIGEVVAASAQLLGSGTIDNLLSDFKESTQKMEGAGGTYVAIDKVTGDFVRSSAQKITQTSSDMDMSVSYHTNKVDTTITLKGNDTQHRLSVKNYSRTNNISLVSNTPLSSILETLGEDFAGHYANVISAHEDGTDENYVKAYQDLVRYKILEIALLGYDKANQPTVFLFFNSSATNPEEAVKAYDINAMLYRMLIRNAYSIDYIINDEKPTIKYSPYFGGMTAEAQTLFAKHLVHLKITSLSALE
jgi:hypothetical protein